jgi:hypothetical protein
VADAVTTTTAQVPKGGGEDRVYVVRDAVVILLDGASAFRPVPVPTSEYVDVLGAHLVSRLVANADLRAVLWDAIDATARQLRLTPGRSPSSTVAIVRTVADQVECLVLGDNLVVFPDQAVTDERLSRIGQQYRERYRERLMAGHGYDQEHRDVLKDLQAEQVRYRNRPGGYWIAEAVPEAAEHAIIVQRPITSTPWAVLASDGAYKPMTHLALADWPRLEAADDEELEHILTECERWESEDDPRGIELPRAKQHDDKTLAVTTFSTVSRAG